MASLAFSEMFDRRNSVEAPHRNTCQWILDLASYREWQSGSKGLLWIKGKPGAGKSTLMTFLYNSSRDKRDNDRSVVHLDFFFNARGSELQHSPVGMLRSLLNQLFRQDPGIRDVVRIPYQEKTTTFGNSESVWTWQRRELEVIFAKAIAMSAQRQLVNIFIDALDEAGEQAARELVHYFHNLNDQLSKPSTATKICISSRHYPVLSQVRGIEICVEDHNQNDIMLFVRDRLHTQVVPAEVTADFETWHSLPQEVVTRSRGVFQWVCLVVSMVEKSLIEGDSLKCIRQQLSQVPEELGEIYKHILMNVIDHRHRSRSLLLFQWVCLAQRPLSVVEMRFAMAANDLVGLPSEVRCCETPNYIADDESMIRQIRAWSGGLVEVTKDSMKEGRLVQVIHQSINDFLMSHGFSLLAQQQQQQQRNNIPTGLMTPRTIMGGSDVIHWSHGVLYQCCLNYLATEDLVAVTEEIMPAARKAPNSGKGPDPLQISCPFIDYAYCNVFRHAGKALDHRLKDVEKHVKLLEQVVEGCHAIYEAMKLFDFRALHPLHHNGITALHVAAGTNMIDVVRYLIEKGVNVELRDDGGYTALHLAAQQGHLTSLEHLMSAGASTQAIAGDGQTALTLAAGHGHLDLVEWLLDHGVIPITGYGNVLQKVVKRGNLEISQLLLSAGADANVSEIEYGTALHLASSYGHLKIAQLLLNAGADVNIQGGLYGNALTAASHCGHEKIVQMLLDANAIVNVSETQNGNALQAASYCGHKEIVQMLLRAGADVNAPGGPYGNALEAASQYGSEEMVRMLLEAGADVNVRSHGPCGGAYFPITLSDGKPVRICSVTDPDYDYYDGGFCGNALQTALHYGHKKIVQILLEAGADTNYTETRPESLLGL